MTLTGLILLDMVGLLVSYVILLTNIRGYHRNTFLYRKVHDPLFLRLRYQNIICIFLACILLSWSLWHLWAISYLV